MLVIDNLIALTLFHCAPIQVSFIEAEILESNITK